MEDKNNLMFSVGSLILIFHPALMKYKMDLSN